MKRSVKAEKKAIITTESPWTWKFTPTRRRSRKQRSGAVAIHEQQPTATQPAFTSATTGDPPSTSIRTNILPSTNTITPDDLLSTSESVETCSSAPGIGTSTSSAFSTDVVVNTAAKDMHFAYLRLLEATQTLTILDKAVVMRDVDVHTMTLKQYQYCVVYTRLSYLCCTCNSSRSSFISRMKESAQAVLTDQYGECPHIKIAKVVADSLESKELGGGFPSLRKDFPSLTPLTTLGHLLVQVSEWDYGVILARGGKLTCGICTKACCKHKEPVKLAIDAEVEEIADIQWVLEHTQDTELALPTIITTKPIGLQEQLTSILCACGVEPEKTAVDVVVFSNQGSQEQQCMISKCQQCLETSVDTDVALLSSYAVDNDTLRHYLHLFCTNALSLYGFYKSLCWKVFDNTRRHPTIRYVHLRNAWMSFVDHLDYDTKATFRCDQCQDAPTIVVGDGIALSFQRRFRRRDEELAHGDNLVFRGLSHSDLVFIDHKPTRHWLMQWVEGNLDDSLGDQLSHLHLLLSQHCPPLVEGVSATECPNDYQWLLKDLAKSSPVSALVPTSALPFLRIIVASTSLSSLECKAMSELSPFLFKLWADDLHKLNWVRQCLQIILGKLTKLHDSTSHPDVPNHSGNLGYFPHLPVVRSRGLYTLDKQPMDCVCTKNASGHPSPLPGLFTLHCTHGICIGYSVMEKFESPNVPFTLLRTRFAKAPKVVIYDNACNLAAYSLKRDPGFFKDTLFLVDRFHYRNHTACSTGYDIDNYPQYKDINTQVAEQSNSCIYRLRGMLSYANEKNFNGYLQLFLAFRNSLSRARHGMDIQYSELFSMMSAIAT